MSSTTLAAPRPDVASPAAHSPRPTLAVPPDVRLKVDAEGFAELSAANRDLRLELTADRRLIVMMPSTLDIASREAELCFSLVGWSKASGLGKGFAPDTGFTLPNGAIRAPDASWLRLDRWKSLDKDERRRFSRIAPDFVAEIRCLDDALPELQAKMAEYTEQGVRLGWLVDPMTQTVEIHRPGRDVETLDKPKTLSGEDVLPDFTLDLAEILYD